MKLYFKALSIDGNNTLVSCHGGKQEWAVGETVTIPSEARGGPCAKGALHALRARDLPFWLGTHYAVVEMPSASEHDNKVYGYEQTIVRLLPDNFDGLDMLVRLADWCAAQGANYTDAAAADWILSQFPADFVEGVER